MASSTSVSEDNPGPPWRRFKTAGDAAHELRSHYGDRSAELGKYALQIVFALIATNWVLHGSQQAILRDAWARASIVVAIGYFILLLVLMGLMVWLLRWRLHNVDFKQKKFAPEFESGADDSATWPYTFAIERTGHAIRMLHVLAPLCSGVFLLVGVFATPTNSLPPEPGKSGDVAGCCAGVAGDVAAIRRSVEAAVAGGRWRESAPTPESGDRVIVVPGKSQLWINNWAMAGIILSLAAAIAGGALLVSKGRATKTAVGASLLTIGTLSGGGLALIKDVRFDSLVTVDVGTLVDRLRIEMGRYGGVDPQRLGAVAKFKIGDDRLVEAQPNAFTAVDEADEIRDMAAAWIKGRGEGKNAVLLVIGATDRLPIAGRRRQQYDANAGLAMARGEAVKNALLVSCHKQAQQSARKCDLNEDQIIVLVSGPRHTPNAGDTSPRASAEGFPEDRRVDVWAFWTRKEAGLTIGR